MQMFLCGLFRSKRISNLSLLRNRLHGGAPRRGATGHHVFHVLWRHNIFSRIYYEQDCIEFSQSSSGLSANRVQNSLTMSDYIFLLFSVSQFINSYAAGTSASFKYFRVTVRIVYTASNSILSFPNNHLKLWKRDESIRNGISNMY